VNVDAAAPILKTEQSSTSAEVAVEAFSELPLSAGGGRSPQNFINLTPGVASGSVNGSQQSSAQVSMDGLTVQNAENPGATNNVRFPPEAVSEMSIVTTAYSAEYGQTGGGVQRYEIKSGTNSYHGNLYEYLKNTDSTRAVSSTSSGPSTDRTNTDFRSAVPSRSRRYITAGTGRSSSSTPIGSRRRVLLQRASCRCPTRHSAAEITRAIW
jgi:hypothetical protein